MKLTAKQRLRGRQRYEALGLPVPPEYQLQAKGWKPGRKPVRKPRSIPVYVPGMDSLRKYKARQTFMSLGLPVPEWCAPKNQREPAPKKNKTGMSMEQYEAMPAPPGAKFKAIDCSGDAWFFDSEPKPKDWAWTNSGNVRYLGEVVCIDWVKSLRAI